MTVAVTYSQRRANAYTQFLEVALEELDSQLQRLRRAGFKIVKLTIIN